MVWLITASSTLQIAQRISPQQIYLNEQMEQLAGNLKKKKEEEEEGKKGRGRGEGGGGGGLEERQGKES